MKRHVLLLSALITSGSLCALTPEQEELREALRPENINAYKDEVCFLLKNEKDIKTCAQVKGFMAQALGNTQPGRKGNWAGGAAGGACTGVIGALISCTLWPKSPDLCVVVAAAGTLAGTIAGYEGMNWVRKPNVEAFARYFAQLADNPHVTSRDSIVQDHTGYNNRHYIEKTFIEQCNDYSLVETSPFFAEFRTIMAHDQLNTEIAEEDQE